MKYGCNFSHELLEILEENSDFCDYIKIGAFGDTFLFMEKALSKKPLLIHGFGWYERAGMEDLSVLDFRYMNKSILAYQSPWIGFHALMFEKDFCPSPFLRMKENLKRIQENLEVPLLIENMDYSPYYSYETTLKTTVEADFINKLVKEVDCGFLLDVSHAKVSAWQLDQDIYAYLEQLPLEKLREIHFSGAEFREGEGFHDRHSEMSQEDYLIAEYLGHLNKKNLFPQLEIITLEYGSLSSQQKTDKEAIQRQMKCLKAIFG
ncbi:MAG: DUF692 family protein [Vallitaleaceae bacterium]|nr:DUF692 family protein [Vallitaleaceae bacterium]